MLEEWLFQLLVLIICNSYRVKYCRNKIAEELEKNKNRRRKMKEEKSKENAKKSKTSREEKKDQHRGEKRKYPEDRGSGKLW